MKNTLIKCSLLAVSAVPTGLFAKQPHIILIMTDQQRGDCLGKVNSDIITPNLDHLANDGYLFHNGYSSAPSSTPARACLLTGMSPWGHGLIGHGRIARKYPFEMPRMLRESGYHAFGIGKMHFFPQKALHGFNTTLVNEDNEVDQDGFVSDYRDWVRLMYPGVNPDILGFHWNDNRGAEYPLDEKIHCTTWTSETAITLLKNYNLDKPLFLKISFTRPHSPYDPPKRFVDMYANKHIPAPAVGEWSKPFALLRPDPKSNIKDPAFGDFGLDFALNSKKHYYAAVTFVDEKIGQIIATLKEKGMYDDAIIVFVADHGDMMGDHYHWRKTYSYQGSAHIPFIVKLPKSYKSEISKGTILEYPVELRDVLPTFLEIAGRKVPEKMEGKSIISLMTTKNSPWRDYIDLEHATTYQKANNWCALTDGKQKYIWFMSTGKEQLFDLKKDPQEVNELSNEKKYSNDLIAWRSKMVKHLEVRGETYAKDGKLQIIEKRTPYAINYPTDFDNNNEDKDRLNYFKRSESSKY